MSQFGKKEGPGGGSEPPTENLPEIDSITPASAPPGAVVTLQGVNFGRRVTASQVTFDVYAPDLPAVPATIVSWNDSTVQVRVPSMESLGARGGRPCGSAAWPGSAPSRSWHSAPGRRASLP